MQNVRLFNRFLLLSTVALLGCNSVTDHPTEIGDSYIQNNSLNFNGYRFDFPPGYTYVDPHSVTPDQVSDIVFYNETKKKMESGPVKYRELFLIKDRMRGKRFIFFSTFVEPRITNFKRFSTLQRKAILTGSMWEWGYEKDKREILKRGEKLIGHVSITEESFAHEVYIVLGGVRETYRFHGFAPKHERNLLNLEMTMAIDGLSF